MTTYAESIPLNPQQGPPGHVLLHAANSRDRGRSVQHNRNGPAHSCWSKRILSWGHLGVRGVRIAGTLHLGVASGKLAAARLMVQGRQPSMLQAPWNGHCRRAREQPTTAVLLAQEPDHRRRQSQADLLRLPCTSTHGALRQRRCQAEALALRCEVTCTGKTDLGSFSCQLLADRGRQCRLLDIGRNMQCTDSGRPTAPCGARMPTR